MSSRYKILTVIILAAFLTFYAIFRSWNCIVPTTNYRIFYQHKELNYFPRTDFNQSLKKTGEDFWNSTKPSFNCSEKKRVGRVHGDGGKWTCGLRTLANLTLQSHYPCVIYSFGVAGESSFEEEILQVSHCEIFAYDMSNKAMGPEIKKYNPRVRFRPQGIRGTFEAKKNLKTLKELMDSNGHSWIDILKMDVEGSEYKSLGRVFTDFEQLPFGQLLIELHSYSWFVYRKKIINVLRGLEDRGMRIFNVEINDKCKGRCTEYALINVHALKLFGQDH